MRCVLTNISSDKNYLGIWNAELDSGNRESSEEYLESKAQEQAWIVNKADQGLGCIDLGCGAGELLAHLVSELNIQEALDFSENMLSKARTKLRSGKVKFVHDDPFSYLPGCGMPVWLTTGALNQYLDKKRMDVLLEVFMDNSNATSFYLFDCVDPLRVAILGLGSDFVPFPKRSIARSLLSKLYSLTLLMTYLSKIRGGCIKFKKRRFGFGYLPDYWNQKAIEKGLQIVITSSVNFEYRYHVVLRKQPLES